MNPRISKIYESIKKFTADFLDGDFFGLSAEISFYLLSSLFPMVIMVFTAGSAISLYYTDIMYKVLALLPHKVEILLVNMLKSHGESAAVIAITATLSITTMSGFILTAQKGLLRFYKQEGTRSFWKSRIIAFVFAILIFVSIIASFGLIIFARLITTAIMVYKPGKEILFLWNISRYFAIFVFIALVISALYKALPTAKLKIREVIPGALFTTVAWYLASMLFALYVNNFPQYEIIYGSLAGFVCMIVWIYMISMIILAGAKINALIYNRKLIKKNYNEF